MNQSAYNSDVVKNGLDGQAKCRRPKANLELRNILKEANFYNPRHLNDDMPVSYTRVRTKPSSTSSLEKSHQEIISTKNAKHDKRILKSSGKDVHKTPNSLSILLPHKRKYQKRSNTTPTLQKKSLKINQPSVKRKRGRPRKYMEPDKGFVNWIGPRFTSNDKIFASNNDLIHDEAWLENITPASTIKHKTRKNNDMKHIIVQLKTPLSTKFSEKYWISFDIDEYRFNPMSEIGKLIEYFSLIYLPTRYANALKLNVIPKLNESFANGDAKSFVDAVEAYNMIIDEIPHKEIASKISRTNTVPLSFFHDILQIAYSRSIYPRARALKKYKAFSSFVYGELLPKFLSEVYKKCSMNKGTIFMDLGSGVGNCVLQAALEYKCKLSFGCEIMDDASELAELQYRELVARCKLYGLELGTVEYSLRRSFVNNPRVDQLLKECDILLVNNFLFDSTLDIEVSKILQNAKAGCQIITLKDLRSPGYKLNTIDLDHIFNRLHVQKYDLEPESVSWTSSGGVYYISTVLDHINENLLINNGKCSRTGTKIGRYTR